MCKELFNRLEELATIDNEKYNAIIDQAKSLINEGYEIVNLDVLSNIPPKEERALQKEGDYTSSHMGVILREKTFAYNTVRNGAGYNFDCWIARKATGIKDLDGRDIYSSPDGTKYVVHRTAGSPEYFPTVTLKRPNI